MEEDPGFTRASAWAERGHLYDELLILPESPGSSHR